MRNQAVQDRRDSRTPTILATNPPAILADPPAETVAPKQKDPAKAGRWWAYQRERFPVLLHGPVIALFGASAVCFSLLLSGETRLPGWRTLVTACVVSLLFFLQLRIADEWKDYADDLRYRPYRPVPRGLVTLEELRTVWVLGALTQLLLTVWLGAALVPFLLLVWFYMALMAKEFFAGAWLRSHPVAYLFSHMLIMPLIYLYATACHWRIAGHVSWAAIAWFLVSGFFNGMVFEFGRKIRAPRDEEPGVETYTALWGRKHALMAWLTAIACSAATALLASRQLPLAALRLVLASAVLLLAIFAGLRFLREPLPAGAKRIEQLSGIWTLLLLLSLGPLPLLVSL
jgi:hypothetical protein